MQLITHKTNIHYLIGFNGSAGFLILGKKKNYFFTDFRYSGIAAQLEKSNTRIPFKFIEIDKDFESNLKKVIGKSKTIKFESAHITIDELKSWKKKLKGLKFIPSKNQTEKKRQLKDKTEIKLLKKSQQINEKTLGRIKKLLKSGISELEIAWKIKSIGHELGAEDISFEPIVAFGDHSATPHHQNTSRKLKKQDIVLIDMGMKYRGYCSDMTRVFFIGKPTSDQVAIYLKVLDAQEETIKLSKLESLAKNSMK